MNELTKGTNYKKINELNDIKYVVPATIAPDGKDFCI